MTEAKVLPSNEEAEKVIIGSIIYDESILDKVIPWLPNGDAFWYNFNKDIYNTFIRMKAEDKPIDLHTTLQELKQAQGDKFNHMKYITDFGEQLYVPGNVEYFARSVYEKFLQRKFIEKNKQIESKAYSSTEEFNSMLNELGKVVDEIIYLQPSKFKSIQTIIHETETHIKEKSNIIQFTSPVFNKSAGGLTRKEISVLGGRPSHAKTTVAINMALDIADQGLKVQIFNREMSNIEMMKKILCIRSKLPYSKVRRGELTMEEEFQMEEAFKEIKKLDNLAMYDDIRDLEGSIREIKKFKPDFVIDDHIGLIKPLYTDQRRHEIASIMEEYKWISKYENCHIMVVSQLNRELEKRIFDPRPKMSDYAESGVIEQLAELCMFTFRGYVFDPAEYSKYSLEFIVAKSRYGDIKTYPIGFDGNACKLYRTEEEARLNSR